MSERTCSSCRCQTMSRRCHHCGMLPQVGELANPEPQPLDGEALAEAIGWLKGSTLLYFPGSDDRSYRRQIAATLSSYSRLLAEGEEMRKDKERLDWLDRTIITRDWIDRYKVDRLTEADLLAARSEGWKDG